MKQEITLCCRNRRTKCPQAALENGDTKTFVVWDIDQSEPGKIRLTQEQIKMLFEFSGSIQTEQ